MKKGTRIVRGTKELSEKLGRRDPYPCGSFKRFGNCCRNTGGYDGVNRNYYVR